jgi:hypothetical protein
MWVDHVSTEGVLLGMRQAAYSGGVFHCGAMNPSGTDSRSPACLRLNSKFFDLHLVKSGQSWVCLLCDLFPAETQPSATELPCHIG